MRPAHCRMTAHSPIPTSPTTSIFVHYQNFWSFIFLPFFISQLIYLFSISFASHTTLLIFSFIFEFKLHPKRVKSYSRRRNDEVGSEIYLFALVGALTAKQWWSGLALSFSVVTADNHRDEKDDEEEEDEYGKKSIRNAVESEFWWFM